MKILIEIYMRKMIWNIYERKMRLKNLIIFWIVDWNISAIRLGVQKVTIFEFNSQKLAAILSAKVRLLRVFEKTNSHWFGKSKNPATLDSIWLSNRTKNLTGVTSGLLLQLKKLKLAVFHYLKYRTCDQNKLNEK